MSVSVTEATRQRLAISKAVFGPKHDLTILDKLSVPKNFDDLVMQIQAQDCNMFFPMIGQPRAYMDIPVLLAPDNARTLAQEMWGGNPDVMIERWVYQVFHWWMPGTRSKCEATICEAAWKDFVSMRREFAQLYGDASPLMVIRRQPEFEQERRPTRCRLNMRFAIPGLKIEKYKHCVDGLSDQCTEKYQVALEPIV